MPDDVKKYLDGDGVRYLWARAKGIYQRKEDGKGLSSNDYTDEEKEKLSELENYELPVADTDVLGGIMIGEGLSIDAEGIVHTVYNPDIPMDWSMIEDTPTSLEGYGITDAATKEELEDVREEVSKAYHFKGSVNTYSDLSVIIDPQIGDIYNVRDTGKNYAWAIENYIGFWDDLGGIIDIDSVSSYDIDVITRMVTTENAFKALIQKGGEITVCNNITLTAPIEITRDTTIDLEDNFFTGNIQGYAFTVNGASLTIKDGGFYITNNIAKAINGGEIIIDNGSFLSNDIAFMAIGENSKVTFNNGVITAVNGGIGASEEGSIEVNGGRIYCSDKYPVFTDAEEGHGENTVVINNGELYGSVTSEGYESCCVYIANNDTFEMNGGYLNSTDGCGILMRGGEVTLNGGEVIAEKAEEDSHSPGWVGDQLEEMSCSAIIYDQAADYPGNTGMSLIINGGHFSGVDHSLQVLSNEVEPNVTIEGGIFEPEYPET